MTNIFVHSLSDVMSDDVGEDTKVWQFCVVLPGAKIGKNCNICSHCFIENDVVIGNNCTIKNGVQIWDGTSLEDNVFIGPNVTFTNDVYPRSRRDSSHEVSFPKTLIKSGASIGGGAVILPGITIGCNAIIGAGAVVVDDVGDGAVIIGPKAKHVRQIADS